MPETDNLKDKSRHFDLEHFFELSPDLICIAGFDGYFQRVNPTVYQTLGYDHHELFSRPINSFVHPDDQDVTASNREKLTQNIPLLNFENRYITNSGDIVWLAWTSMPIYSEQVVFAIAKNITHKKKIEDDRNSQLADLARINKDLKQLTYTAAHDLRTPVSNLLSVFELLDPNKITDGETREFIYMLRSATEALSSTLNNYVDALSSKRALGAKTEDVNLSATLKEVTGSLSSLLNASQADIAVNFDAFEKVRFVQAYMKSVFLNLISNSVKYAKPGQAPVIQISTRITGGKKQLIFRDEGSGFDLDKVRNRLFGLNQHFHDRPDSKGIGLYLVNNYVLSLGGHIDVESAPGQGASFIITFGA